MSDRTSESDLEERKLKLEERKVALAERQLELDSDWVKRWAPLIIPGIITAAALIITNEITSADQATQAQIARTSAEAQREETVREDFVTDREKALEGNRAVAEMYFDKLGNLESKENLTSFERSQLVKDLKIIALVSDTSEVGDIFKNDAAQIVASAQSETVEAGLQTNQGAASQALTGFPDLVPVVPSGNYSASAFLAFPQVPGKNDPDENKFFDSLKSLGFKVQPTQHMAPGQSPSDNEIRYYRSDQACFAAQVADELLNQSGLKFVPKQLHTPGLPNGVMEFWLGTNAPSRAQSRTKIPVIQC